MRVALRGELDLEHAYTFDEGAARGEETRPPCILVDLRELGFVDSCGIARLPAAQRLLATSRRAPFVRGCYVGD